MQLYLDTSALTKLVVSERETAALQTFLSHHHDDNKFVSALARTELIRSVVRRGMLDAIPHARRLLSRIESVPLTSRLLDEAFICVHLRFFFQAIPQACFGRWAAGIRFHPSSADLGERENRVRSGSWVRGNEWNRK